MQTEDGNFYTQVKTRQGKATLQLLFLTHTDHKQIFINFTRNVVVSENVISICFTKEIISII